MMVKPEDIAADVWDTAFAAMPAHIQANYKDSPFSMVLHLGFARAILAERERVIAILDGIDRTETDKPEGWWETSSGADFGEKIIAAIRGTL